MDIDTPQPMADNDFHLDCSCAQLEKRVNGMDDNLTIKWLGISGVALRLGGESILIDPVFSRIRFARVAFGRLAPDADTLRRQVPGGSHIFITHAHYDHLLDAPALCALSGAVLHGSANVCAIAAACGVRGENLHLLTPASKVETACFAVTALAASHIRLPGFGYGAAKPRLAPPLRARQYRMDESYVFLVEAGGARLLIGPGLCLCDPGRVDALLCCPLYLGDKLEAYVSGLRPQVFVPIHWEDMFRPVAKPMRPGLVPSFPPHRLDMRQVQGKVATLGVRYLELEIFREYSLKELL